MPGIPQQVSTAGATAPQNGVQGMVQARIDGRMVCRHGHVCAACHRGAVTAAVVRERREVLEALKGLLAETGRLGC